MDVANLNIRTDREVKIAAEQIFEALGMNMSTAINIFLRQAIIANGLPFEVKLKTPNDETLAAMEESHRIAFDKSVKGYTNIDDLRTALEI